MRKPPPGSRLNYAHPAARDLRAAWLLNEGAGIQVADALGNHPKGTVAGGVATARWSPYGARFNTAITDYIGLGNHPAAHLPFPFTVSVAGVVNSTTPSNILYSSDVYAAYGGFEALVAATGTLGVTLGDGNGAFSNHRRSGGTTATPVVAGVPFHAVFVIRGGTSMEIYCNGVPYAVSYSGTGNMGLLPAYTGNPAELGRRSAGTALGFAGSMAHCMLWARALTPSEIVSLYARPYAMFRPRSVRAATGGGFKPAWARGANLLIR